eukprot:m.185392 g.185392  ORF g.185392 m.185392 type:complete len:421 (+) comp15026_c1_seq2:116-1378(+)
MPSDAAAVAGGSAERARVSPQIQSVLKTAGVSAAEVDAAVETLRGSCDVSNRGLTFQFLTDYLALATDSNPYEDFSPEFTTYSLVGAVVADTVRWNCSVAEIAAAIDLASNPLEEKDAAMPLAYSPTHFLSYSWSMPLIDVKEVARTVTKELGDGWGLWLDVLTINQHQGDRTQADLAAVGECIARTGSLLFVVDARGTALSRVWCIYEIMTAVRADCDITVVFSGKNRSAFDSAIIALTVLAGRFDHIDVRDAQATVASDKALILEQVAANPGLDALSDLLRTTLRDHARQEFAKKAGPFGSAWWSGPEHFPEWVLEGLLKTIELGGGWGSLLVTEEAERDAYTAARVNGSAEGKHEAWRPKRAGELDQETPLYQKLILILKIITFGQQAAKFKGWKEVEKAVDEAAAASAAGNRGTPE